MPLLNYKTICAKVLEGLPGRHKEVVLKRFGLEGNNKETLESIGKSYGITRERVRQIENDAMAKLEEKREEREVRKTFFHISQYLKEKGDLKREDILLTDLGKNSFDNEVYFLLNLGDNFHHFKEDEKIYPFWSTDIGILKKVLSILDKAQKKLQKDKKPVASDDFFALTEGENLDKFNSVIEISKSIEKSPLGYFGLVSWPEVKPKGVRDRAYIALKKIGEPMHFREIADYSSQLEGGICPKKTVLSQTVHNELIRDPRFVLVGRGIYALSEWGYNPGTVREIIKEVLGNSKKPLTKEEVVGQVLSQRLVKENTILLNLQDKSHFLQDKQGRYTLKN